MELRPAVALQRAEHVARQTLRVNPHERRHARLQLAFEDDDELFAGVAGTIAADLKLAILGRQTRHRHTLNR